MTQQESIKWYEQRLEKVKMMHNQRNRNKENDQQPCAKFIFYT